VIVFKQCICVRNLDQQVIVSHDVKPLRLYESSIFADLIKDIQTGVFYDAFPLLELHFPHLLLLPLSKRMQFI